MDIKDKTKLELSKVEDEIAKLTQKILEEGGEIPPSPTNSDGDLHFDFIYPALTPRGMTGYAIQDEISQDLQASSLADSDEVSESTREWLEGIQNLTDSLSKYRLSRRKEVWSKTRSTEKPAVEQTELASKHTTQPTSAAFQPVIAGWASIHATQPTAAALPPLVAESASIHATQPTVAALPPVVSGSVSINATQPTTAAQPVLMSDYSKYKVKTNNLDIPEFCFYMQENLSLQDNKDTRCNNADDAEEAANIVSRVGVILSAMMNSCGGVLHIKHVNSNNKDIAIWLNTLNDKLQYIPRSAFVDCISICVIGGQDVFIYVRKSMLLIVRTHMYWRSPVGASSEADMSLAQKIISNKKRPHQESTTTLSCTALEYDSVMSAEGMHREYKHYKQVRDITDLITKLSGCFKDILSLANCRGGGCFIIGVDDESLKVKGLPLTDTQKDEFKIWLCNWLIENDDGHKRIWGKVFHVPEEGKDWTLNYIPVANHPDGSDYYVCVLTMHQCLGGVFTSNPEFYTVDISGEICRQPHKELIALLTTSPKQNQPLGQRVPETPSKPTSPLSSSTSLSSNNSTNQQPDSSQQSQVNPPSYPPLFSGALWSRCTEWASPVGRVGPDDTHPRAVLEMTNPFNIVGERHIIERISSVSLENFCIKLCSEFAQEKGFAFFVSRLCDCMPGCAVQTPIDHVCDVVVFLESSRLCLISCFKSPPTDSNRQARCQYVFQLARILKYDILSMTPAADTSYDVKVETFISTIDCWTDAMHTGQLQDFYNKNIYTDGFDASYLGQYIDARISCNMVWVRNRLGELKTYRLTEEQIDAKNSLTENKLSVVDAPTGCGKSILGTHMCRLYGNQQKVLYATPGKGFMALIKYQCLADAVHVTEDANIDKVLEQLKKDRYEIIIFDDVQAMECSPSFWTQILEEVYPKLKKLVFLCNSQFQDYHYFKTVDNLKFALDKFTKNRYPGESWLSTSMRNWFLVAQTESKNKDHTHRCGNSLQANEVEFDVIEQALADNRTNKLLTLLEKIILGGGDHSYNERDIMLLLCDGDDEQADTLCGIISRHSNYKPCRADDVPHKGVVVDVVDAAIGLEASVCILVWLKHASKTDDVRFRVFAASRKVMKVTLIFPRPFSPEEAKKLGLQDRTTNKGRMPDEYNSAAVRDIRLPGGSSGSAVWGITASRAGELFLADRRNGQIRVVLDYELRSVIPVDGGACDVCITPAGDVAVACGLTVRMYTADGSEMWRTGKKGNGPGEYKGAADITSDGAGRLYVADYNNRRVSVLDQTGSFIQYIGVEEGEGRLQKPGSVAVQPHTGRVYVADRGRRDIAVYTPDGGYLRRITEVKYPMYLSFRSDGLLAVCDGGGGDVFLLLDDRRIQTLSLGTVSGRQSCVFLHGGDLVVCDGNDRLRVFTNNTEKLL